MFVSVNLCCRLVENATETFAYHVEGLSPYTQYMLRVVISHAHGQTVGPWATLRTAEDSKCTDSHTHKYPDRIYYTYSLLTDACMYTFAHSKRETDK